MFEDSVSAVPSIWATMSSWLTPTVLFVLLNVMIGTIAITSNLGSSSNNNKKYSNQQHQPNQEQDNSNSRQLARSPSMLQRLKSINFHAYKTQEPQTFYQDMNIHHSQQHASFQVQDQELPFFRRSPSMLQRLKSIKLYNNYTSHEEKTEDTHYSSHKTRQENESRQEQEEEEEHHMQEFEDDENNKNEKKDMSIDEVYSHVSRTKSDTAPVAGEFPPKLPKKMKKSASVTSAFSHFEESDVVETRRPATVREGKSTVTAVEADAEVDAKADDFINKFKKQLKLQRIDSIIRYKEMITRGTAK